VSEPESKKEIILSEIGKCKACRFCLDACPTYEATGKLETLSAYGRLQVLRYLLLGILDLDDSLSYALYSCLQCKRCENVCGTKGQNLRIVDIIRTGRALLAIELAELRPDEKS
jgi:glycolate oxidase iron-sulfur subunit